MGEFWYNIWVLLGEYWYIWVVLVIILVIGIISTAIVKVPGKVLQQKFIKLGTLKGKTLNEIQSACGAPSYVSYGEDGVKIYQWAAAIYQIVLLFDENDICLGVSSETIV